MTLENNSIEKIISKYGITVENMEEHSIRRIETVRLRHEDLYNIASYIPDDLKEYIDKFELIWTISLSVDYAEAREINEEIAVRELIQNALDAEHEAYDYYGIDVKVYNSKLGTHVADRGRGITWRAFIIGKSEKPPEYSRGKFGEGLKIASLYLASKNIDTYIFTKYKGKPIVFKVTAYGRESTVIALGTVKKWIGREGETTNVLVKGYTLDRDLVDLIYWKNNKSLSVIHSLESKVVDENTGEVRHIVEHVFEDKDERKKLYVRDMFVNTFHEIFNKNAIYSYNLWDIELEPNRKMVRNPSEVYSEITRVLLSSPTLILKLIDRCLHTEKISGTVNYTLESVKTYVEGKIDRYIAQSIIDKKKKSDPKYIETLREGLRKLFLSKGIDVDKLAFVKLDSTYNHERVERTIHEGYRVIKTPESLAPILAVLLNSADAVVLQSVLDTVRNIQKVTIDKETNLYKIALYSELLAIKDIVIELLKPDLFSRNDPDTILNKINVVPISARSNFDVEKNIIYIDMSGDRNYVIETFIHELTHAVGRVFRNEVERIIGASIESVADLSQGFVRVLNLLARYMYIMHEEPSYRTLLRRIRNNCVGASLTKFRQNTISNIQLKDVSLKIPFDMTIYEKYLLNPPLFIIIYVKWFKDGSYSYNFSFVEYPTVEDLHPTRNIPFFEAYYKAIEDYSLYISKLIQSYIRVVTSDRKQYYDKSENEILDSIVNKLYPELLDLLGCIIRNNVVIYQSQKECSIGINKYIKYDQALISICESIHSILVKSSPCPDFISVLAYDIKGDCYKEMSRIELTIDEKNRYYSHIIPDFEKLILKIIYATGKQ